MEGWMERQTRWVLGGSEPSRPRAAGIAVMLTDVCKHLHCQYTHKKYTRKTKTTMRANEEASNVNIHNDAKQHQILQKERNRTDI